MSEIPENVPKLLHKLESLRRRQDAFQQEIEDLRTEINYFKTLQSNASDQPEVEKIPSDTISDSPEIKTMPTIETKPEPLVTATVSEEEKPKRKSDIEKFIGENLINKIGIAVTIIGVGIGAKYAIDHELISPLARIILGYLIGFGLLGFSLYLKKQYHNFSAVLMSGSMAIHYLITFAAYNFFDLIPVVPVFIIMALITIFTVGAAIFYNRQVIAHFGLVGAYAVPFLLSDGSGRVGVLFSYMTLINAGILIISIQRYWKPLLYSSFIITWLIFIQWFFNLYNPAENFAMGLVFASIFFLIFYVILMGYKLLKKEMFELEDILLLLANSAVFFGLGYSMLRQNETADDLQGLFALANSAIHLIFWGIIFRNKRTDRTLIYFIGGLAIVFLIIAIPVQFDGRWVTLLWAAEAALLFFLGRTKQTAVYEWLSFPLMFLVFFSLIHDWSFAYNQYLPDQPETRIFPILNINFLTSVIVIASLGFITWLNVNRKFTSSLTNPRAALMVMNIAIPAMLIIILYFSFFLEISTCLTQYYSDSRIDTNHNFDSPQYVWNKDIVKYRTIAIMVYSLLFFSILSYVNTRIIKNHATGIVNLILNVIFLALFLTFGLIAIGELRDSYLNQDLNEYYYRGSFNIVIRYVAFLFAGLMLYAIYDYIKRDILRIDFKTEYDFLLHIALLTIASNELINWMDLSHSQHSYKLGLSILFGIYSLILIVLGILKKKKHLRLGAMILFGATLIKLFFYDLVSLDTISKTIIFLSLGILLLIISFLYNKYAPRIFGEHSDDDGSRTSDGK